MCKDCECHEFLDTKGAGYKGDYRGKGHWCIFSLKFQYPHGGTASMRFEKFMKYKEFTKTPEWCPKNQKTYISNGIECPILEVKSGIFN